MNKIREMFKANVVSLKIQKLVIKKKCSPMLAHSFSTGPPIRKFYFKLANRRHGLSEPTRLTNY